MIDLIAQQRFHRIHHSLGTNAGAVNVVVEFIAQPQATDATLRVFPFQSLVHVPVCFADRDQQLHFFLIKETRDNQVPVLVPSFELR